ADHSSSPTYPMMLTTLNLHGKKYYYLLLHDQLGLAHWSLQQTELTRQLEHIASSQFWLHPASNTLCKIMYRIFSYNQLK
ncbi:hypothetical protein ACET8H_20290, partial [Aeromonas veronii]